MKDVKEFLSGHRVAIAVLLVAVVARLAVAAYKAAYGIVWYPTLETWSDFSSYYSWWLHALNSGMVPYRDFFYSYPPLFLYTLFPFYLLGHAEIPIVAFDAGTALVVYLIAREKGERIGAIAGVAYALSPFALVYEGYSWMSTQPMLFFLILSIFCLKRRPVAAAVIFGVAVLFKQEALFVFPVMLYYLLVSGRAKKAILTFVAAILLVSLPFLIIAPTAYLGAFDYETIVRGPMLQWPPPAFNSGISASIITAGASALSAASPVCSYIVSAVDHYTEICTVGTITQTIAYSSPVISVLFTWITPILLLEALGAAFFLRRSLSPHMWFTLSTVSVLVLANTLGILPTLKYYFLPAYALLLLGADTSPALLLAGLAPLPAIFMLGGPLQGGIMVVVVLGVIALDAGVKRARARKAGASQPPPAPAAPGAPDRGNA